VYAKNATVYVAGRSRDVALKAINEIKSAVKSTGRVEFLSLDLANLGSIKSSADIFLAKEDRLDVLWNNAGFMGKSATTAEVCLSFPFSRFNISPCLRQLPSCSS
jgi:NAD(P)-dependent dehydrogenase (short-subunit alcohol dehydrogenase family)